MVNFEALNFSMMNVGKRIKSSKKRMCWIFKLEGKEHELLLYLSRLTGKVRVILDGDVIHNQKRIQTDLNRITVKIGHNILYLD